ncbi:MAG: rRNA maturation RNase YbeY [Alphaproteobacteria bacterium]|nr:MAG: rRNA maturation RNase YbeY [Alphaproteobacteria bacterium]
MTTCDSVIQLRNPAWKTALPDFMDLTNRALAEVAKRHPWDTKELCVVLTDDTEIHELNKAYRNQDKPTNVLSFPAAVETGFLIKEELFPLGDVVIALETMAREADEQGKSLDSHFVHILVHGTLHLLGFDHIKPEDAEEMEGQEVQILGALGISDPYEPLAS